MTWYCRATSPGPPPPALPGACGCLTFEEHLSACSSWRVAVPAEPAPPMALPELEETPEARRRRLNRARVARFKARHPERWREIQATSAARRRERTAA